jgi:hypothetical protein
MERIYEKQGDTLLKPKEKIIRCKDCKFRERFEGGEFYCCGLDDEPLAVDDADFCSWAMPKD